MKVCFLINNMSSGGAERATSSLCNYFSSHGVETEILTATGGESFYALNPEVKLISLAEGEIKSEFSVRRLFGSIGRFLKLRKLIKKEKPDCVIGMSFSMTWYVVAACAFTGIKSVGTERNNPYKYEATKLYTFLRKLFYTFSDAYVFQTEKSAGFFTSSLRDTDVVIPNAIFNETVYTLSPPEKREKVICSVGRLTQQKRFDILLKAFSIIKDKIPEYKLVIFGKGELENELKQLSESLKIDDRVIFAGTSPMAVKAVNLTSCFVLSSEMEGMPNALMEALAMGVPCVSTRCDMGPEELITDGVSGLLTPVNDAESLAKAILYIIENPSEASSFSENGRKLMETNSIDAISNRWLDFLKSI